MYLTLKEATKELSSAPSYYLMRIFNSADEYFLILNVSSTNDRYTDIDIGTDTDDAINGSIQITNTGEYSYIVYGQSSATNLDPSDASVIGIAEYGVLEIISGETFFTDNVPNVPTFKQRYE